MRNGRIAFQPGIMLVGAALALSGCLEVRDDYVLNPDGSGKVRHEAWFQNVNINLTGQAQDPQREMREAVGTLLTQSPGVDTWKEVSFELGSDGRVHFIGTAYFPSLDGLKFKHGSISADLLDFSWKVQPDGSAVLGMREEAEEAGEKTEPQPPGDMAAKIAEERAKFLQMKPMMLGMMGGMKATAVLQLPAKPSSVSNFELLPDGRLSLALDGDQLIRSINDFIMNDERLKEVILEGKTLEGEAGMEAMMAGDLLGREGPVQAVVPAGSAPVFDYTAEVAQAREAFGTMLASLGLSGSTPSAEPIAVDSGEGFKALSIAGVRRVGETGSQSARAFNWTPGYTISLAGRLSGRALAISGGAFEAVETLEGKSILPDSDFQREIHHGSVSEEGNILVWECELKDPGDTRGLKRIRGVIEYTVAEGEETLDLGFPQLAPGTKGREAGAEIQSIDKQSWGSEDQHILRIALRLVPDHLKEIEVRDGKGTPLREVGIQSRMTSGMDDTTLDIRSAEPFPADGTVRLVKHANLKKYRVPFELTDVDLLGRPLAPAQ